MQLRADFEPTAAKYRHLKQVTKWVTIGAVLCFFVPFAVGVAWGGKGPDWPSYLFPFYILAAVAAVVLQLRAHALLKCPGCPHKLEELGTYCPECGHANLTPAVSRWFSTTPAHCQACGRDMVIKSGGKGGRVRQYTIRACSSCGLYLDEEGV